MLSQYDRWPDLFGQMRRTPSELNRIFGIGLVPGIDYPSLDVWAGSEGMIVTAQLPGIDPDQLEVTVHQDTLTLKGSRPDDEIDGEAVCHRRERVHGTFTRDVVLPLRVDADHVSARYEQGILRLELPRPSEDKPRHLKIARA